MLKSPAVRWTLGVVAAMAALTLLRFKPWQRASLETIANSSNAQRSVSGVGKTREELRVGFLPVT
jgi:hypothetical protein